MDYDLGTGSQTCTYCFRDCSKNYLKELPSSISKQKLLQELWGLWKREGTIILLNNLGAAPTTKSQP